MDTVQKKLCNQPRPILQKIDPSVSATRARFIFTTNKKWANGTKITYKFIEGDNKQLDVVRAAFKQWLSLGIGISFAEVAPDREAMVRIGFDYSSGSWSYVGRDILTVPATERTMNFGWDLAADAYGMTTALHEIGHTIGFQHEHMSPFSGIEWNTQAVYTAFQAGPNFWSKEMIDFNILDKLPANQVQGSAWDPDSIMEYQFGPGLINAPAPYRAGVFPPGVLSPKDISGVKSFYPVVKSAAIPTVALNTSAPITAKSGEQNDFIFKAPETMKYTFQVAGQLDTLMVISEKDKEENHYLAGDDDSGIEKNAKITLPLVKGRDYLVNLRVMFSPHEKSGSLIVT